MVTNHNKHNSAWNFLTIEGTGSPCCRRLLEASLNWGTEKLLPFIPNMLASWGHHPTTFTDQVPPFFLLPTCVPNMAAAQLLLPSFFSNPLPWKPTGLTTKSATSPGPVINPLTELRWIDRPPGRDLKFAVW